MRVLVLQAPARDQHAVVGQHLDYDAVRIALLAFVGEDARAGEARCVVREGAVLVDRIRDRRVDAARFELARIRGPDIEVLAAVPGRGVHEAGSCVVRDVIARKQRNDEPVAAGMTLERVARAEHREVFGAGPLAPSRTPSHAPA